MTVLDRPPLLASSSVFIGRLEQTGSCRKKLKLQREVEIKDAEQRRKSEKCEMREIVKCCKADYLFIYLTFANIDNRNIATT